MTDIDVLLEEHRKFKPPEAFRSAANVSSPEVYARAAKDYEAFWAECARALVWSKRFTKVLEWAPPRAKWFSDGELNASVNCVDRHVSGSRRDKAGHRLGGRARRYAHAHLCAAARRGVPLRLRARLARREAGRSRRDLPADDSGSRDRDARLRADWRRALGRVRRILGGVAARSHRRCAGEGAHHGGRRLPAWAGRSAQEECGRRARADADDRARGGRAAHGAADRRHARRNEGRARSMVARAHGEGIAGSPRDRDERRRHPVHALHIGHDGQAEGDRPHHRRLSHAVRRHHADDLRPERERRLLVHCGRRLGDRTFVHRVWSARERRDVHDVRGRARLARKGPLLGAV